MTHDKTLPPTLVLVFVRSEEIDAVAQVIRQPKVKLRELLTELVKCSFRKKFTKRELFSLKVYCHSLLDRRVTGVLNFFLERENIH